MSMRNACRAGMSNAFTTPSPAASTMICHTCTRPVSVSNARIAARIMDAVCVRDHDPLAVVAVGNDASDGRHDEDRNLAGKSDRPQQQRRTGHAIDQPGLGHGLHPGADQRDELTGEEQLEIPVPQGAHGQGQPGAA